MRLRGEEPPWNRGRVDLGARLHIAHHRAAVGSFPGGACVVAQLRTGAVSVSAMQRKPLRVNGSAQAWCQKPDPEPDHERNGRDHRQESAARISYFLL
jgi:hypothetical protein